ncbi:MAG TPA: permease-like cell division protein FtsX [Pseudobdellovibrionaceae bacterium]|nr:permease-like cell division protein FtsX [Pseudobdellovibrionaceae bacterium]
MKNQSLRFSTMMVLWGCYTLMIGSFLLYKNFNQFIKNWGENREMIVYLKNDISIQELESLQTKIKNDKLIETTQYSNKEKVLEQYQGQLASLVPGLNEDPELMNLIPASFELKLQADAAPETIEALSANFQNQDGVEEVSYGKEWLNHFAVLVKVIRTALVSIALIIFGASLFVISNVIHTHVFRKKEEIEILEMLGAGSSMIRFPFLLEGALLGGFSILGAVGLSGFLFVQFKEYIVTQYPLSSAVQSLEFLGGVEFLIVFLGGILASLLSSYFSISHLNTGRSSLFRITVE